MTLAELVNAITSVKIQITLLDANEVELIKFYTGGQSALDATLLSREVSTIKIDNATAITIELKAAIASP